MSKLRLMRWFAAGVLVLSAARSVESMPPNDQPAAADCAFSHPQLPGQCRLTIAVPPHSTPQRTCDSVLRCINATICAEAQTYCPNPGVPKVWKLASASAAVPRADCAFEQRWI